IVEGDERRDAFKALIEKYSGDQPEDTKHAKAADCTRSHVVAIDVEHITGKEALEYAKTKNR
ncbi:MAG: 5-nitroimidazole antibiotic resistance protein, partial [Clostridiales Family XIII bacterium]|nr:5-nitroimidazole antibiotic resistance protein [Clostridiales Family XIII bacterium]